MRVLKSSVLSATSTSSRKIIRVLPVSGSIAPERPRRIVDFQLSTLGEYILQNIDEDADSTFANKILKYALEVEPGIHLFFSTMDEFDDEMFGVLQVKYGHNEGVHSHLTWQGLSCLLMKNESLQEPFEIHFEPPRVDADEFRDVFEEVFGGKELRGEYVLHVTK